MANTPRPLWTCPGWTGPGPGKGCTSGNGREVLGFGLEQFSLYLLSWGAAGRGNGGEFRVNCEAMEDSLVWGGGIVVFKLKN